MTREPVGFNDAIKQRDAAEVRLALLSAEVDRLIPYLMNRTAHVVGCSARIGYDAPCTCGLAEALRLYEARAQR